MNCNRNHQVAQLCCFLIYQTGSGVRYATNLTSGIPTFLLSVGVVEILVLMRVCLRLGGCLYAHRVVMHNKCSAAGRLPIC